MFLDRVTDKANKNSKARHKKGKAKPSIQDKHREIFEIAKKEGIKIVKVSKVKTNLIYIYQITFKIRNVSYFYYGATTKSIQVRLAEHHKNPTNQLMQLALELDPNPTIKILKKIKTIDYTLGRIAEEKTILKNIKSQPLNVLNIVLNGWGCKKPLRYRFEREWQSILTSLRLEKERCIPNPE
jgi:hypothetical protein